MLRPTKKMWARIGAATILGAAFASAAIAAETSGAADATVSTFTAGASNVVSNASLPAVASAAASQVAAQVLDAIAGGSNPSAAASRRSDNASPTRGNAGNPVTGLISAAQQMIGAGTAGTAGVRPGWGCGDKNHTHSGPPGRPDATPPPGCAR